MARGPRGRGGGPGSFRGGGRGGFGAPRGGGLVLPDSSTRRGGFTFSLAERRASPSSFETGTNGRHRYRGGFRGRGRGGRGYAPY